jgi:hypothetical protein
MEEMKERLSNCGVLSGWHRQNLNPSRHRPEQ